MPYIPSWERDAWESGKQIGVEKNQMETIKRMIKLNLSLQKISQITGLSYGKIGELLATGGATPENNPGKK